MINFNRFKDGKKFIATFSYDDGFDTDARLIELFNKYGVKGTFHLNAKRFVNYSQEIFMNSFAFTTTDENKVDLWYNLRAA